MLGIPSAGSHIGAQVPLEPGNDAVLHKAPHRELVAFDRCLGRKFRPRTLAFFEEGAVLYAQAFAVETTLEEPLHGLCSVYERLDIG